MSDNSNNSTNEDLFQSDGYESFEDELGDSHREGSDVSERSLATPRGSLKSDSLLIPPSSGPRWSSPIVGSKAERALIRIKKGRAKRKVTIGKRKDEGQWVQARIKATERGALADKAKRKLVLDEVLESLQTNGLQFWDLMEYVFNPMNGQGSIRYNEFFIKKSNAPKVLDWWMSANNRARQAKDEIREWIAEYAARTMSREAEGVTKSKELQTMGRTVDAQVIKQFDLEEIHRKLGEDLAPFSMRLLQAFSTAKGVKRHTDHRKAQTKMVRCKNFTLSNLILGTRSSHAQPCSVSESTVIPITLQRE